LAALFVSKKGERLYDFTYAVRGIAASRQLLQLLGAKLTGTLHLFDHLVGAQFIYPTGCSLP
jgi:hypothetical protein